MTCLLGKLSGFSTGKASFQGTRKICRDKFNLSTGERIVQGHIYASGTKVEDKKIVCLLQQGQLGKQGPAIHFLVFPVPEGKKKKKPTALLSSFLQRCHDLLFHFFIQIYAKLEAAVHEDAIVPFHVK